MPLDFNLKPWDKLRGKAAKAKKLDFWLDFWLAARRVAGAADFWLVCPRLFMHAEGALGIFGKYLGNILGIFGIFARCRESPSECRPIDGEIDEDGLF